MINVSTISDRTWQCLVKFTIEPSSEAVLHPTNFGFRESLSVFCVQKILYLNLKSSSYGTQKRILYLNISNSFERINPNSLMKKIIAPRNIKIGIFRTLRSGLYPEFSLDRKTLDLSSILANILLNGIEQIHPCVRSGREVLFFLKPKHNEKKIIKRLFFFLYNLNFDYRKHSFKFVSPTLGFEFLDWNFQITRDKKFQSFPSSERYKQFRKKVTNIISNANFGAKTKSNKLFPIVNEWNNQNQFCNKNSSKYSLFLLKRQAFKVFNKEVKQDRYSCKRLLDKAFPKFSILLNDSLMKKSPYSSHLFFPAKTSIVNSKKESTIFPKLVCLHCGLKYTN